MLLWISFPFMPTIFKVFVDMQNIKILDIKKLRVVPQDADRSKLHFQLHYLKNLLPTVVVKVFSFDFMNDI